MQMDINIQDSIPCNYNGKIKMFKIGLTLKLLHIFIYTPIYTSSELLKYLDKVNFNKLFCRRVEDNAYLHYLNFFTFTI